MKTERWQSGLWKSGAVLGLAVVVGASGCKSNQTASTPAPIVDANGGADPAAVNNAPATGAATGSATGAPVSAGQPARVLGQQAYGPAPTSSGEQYPEQGGPGYAPQGQSYPAQGQPYPAGNGGGAGYDDSAYDQQVDAGQEALYASQPPPPLPVYEQPELTEAGDQWTPGYWSYAPQGYYWVPGAWVAPPFIGALWTPGYWGFFGGRYRFNHGFWGRHIGFYGGVPYGFGYTGHGYEGGYWNGDRFFYNNAVNRVNVNVVRNVYARNVTQVSNNRVSYNGPGGWSARPSASEMAVLHEQRVPAMQVQRQRVQEAAGNRQQFAAENHGRPAMAVLAERQPADRVAPASAQGRPEAAAGVRPGNGLQPGTGARPEVPGQMRPGTQVQAGRSQPENQPRTLPEGQRPTQNQQRPQMADQQRQVQVQQRQAQDQQRQVQDQQRQAQVQQRQAQDQQRQVQDQQRQVQDQQRQVQQRQDQQRQVQQGQQRQQQEQQRGNQQRPSAAEQRLPEQQARPMQDAGRQQGRPQPEVQAQPRPEQQSRPQPQAAPAARAPEARPAEAPHPQEGHPHL